jgi:hypothetical protein
LLWQNILLLFYNMKFKSLFSSILFITISANAVAQKIETSITWLTNIPDPANNISYNNRQKLTIEDFKGSTDVSTDAVAITASGFMFTAGYHSKGEKATLSIAVYCSFNKKDSWMKERGKTAYILLHEQHHFDISYLNTLLFIKKIKQTKFKQDEYKEQLKDVYQEVIDKMEAMQHKYDTETQNGINIEKQAGWNKKVEKLLAAAADENIL